MLGPTERCYLVFGPTLSIEQRAEFDAWCTSGMEGKPPRWNPKGEDDWLFVPGCESAAYAGPGQCVCDTLQIRMEHNQSTLEGVRSTLAHKVDRVLYLAEELRRYKVAVRLENRRRRDAGLDLLRLPPTRDTA